MSRWPNLLTSVGPLNETKQRARRQPPPQSPKASSRLPTVLHIPEEEHHAGRRPDPRCLLSLQGLDGLLAWKPEFLRPFEMGRLAVVAPALRAGVGEACWAQLRKVESMLLPSGCDALTFGDRALHRVQRQRKAFQEKVIAAENYSAGVDDNGRLLIWGRPGWQELRGAEAVDGQLQPPLRCIEVTSMKAGEELPKVVHIAASRHAVFALTEHGQLMFAQAKRASGNQKVSGIELRPLAELNGVVIASIATRFGQAYAVTPDGRVYAWGMKCGDPNRQEYACSMGFGEVSTQLHPTRLPGFGPGLKSTPIRFVSSGVSHAVFVSIYGEAYSVGRTENGKLGLGKSVGYSEHVLTPQKVDFQTRPIPTITAASAGHKHTLLLANNGAVWGCGQARHGALPAKKFPWSQGKADKWSPIVLDRLNCFCTHVAAGLSSSFFVDETGSVWYAGTALQTSRPFGRPETSNASVPWKIPDLRRVEHVTVSMELSFFRWEHAVFTRSDGSLCAWGHVGHGEFEYAGSGSSFSMERYYSDNDEDVSSEYSVGPASPNRGAGFPIRRASSRHSRSQQRSQFVNTVMAVESWPTSPTSPSSRTRVQSTAGHDSPLPNIRRRSH
eukprot:TRINITY_DN49159_c0_g1_i1.p1 TRINITY_DN49159_c0_g1~~TRINITY_DN49159_c0_g1_i1.p1  ORF type:complete len:612 (+),score=90.85 TRINITY_DN49159_c0_g1_i1:84-1919(+)